MVIRASLIRTALGMLAALVIAPQIARAADDLTGRCVDISIPRNETIALNGTWIELTADQWQFLRGVYAMNPQTPPGLPYGDKAVLAQVKRNAVGLVFFIDGDQACTPMLAPPELLNLLRDVGTGAINHQGAGL
jgi:hypothetical protein